MTLPAHAGWVQIGGPDQLLVTPLALQMKGLHERRNGGLFWRLMALGTTLALAAAVGSIKVRLVVASGAIDVIGVPFVLKHHNRSLVGAEPLGDNVDRLLLGGDSECAYHHQQHRGDYYA